MNDLVARIPQKVWIGTTEFPISLVDPKHEQLGGGDDNGCCDFDPPGIFISRSLSLTKLLEIATHEITHGINHVYDIEDGADEEVIATRHGVAWSQFWIANPRFARWYLAACVAVRKDQQGLKGSHATRS